MERKESEFQDVVTITKEQFLSLVVGAAEEVLPNFRCLDRSTKECICYCCTQMFDRVAEMMFPDSDDEGC